MATPQAQQQVVVLGVVYIIMKFCNKVDQWKIVPTPKSVWLHFTFIGALKSTL